MAHDNPLPSDIKLRHDTVAENPMDWRWERRGLSAKFAAAAVRSLDVMANIFFRKRYGHRAVLLETVAAVPGMVGANFNHLSSLRKMKHDNGRIRALIDEAENERMHLMTFIEIAKPSNFERMLVIGAQVAFFTFYSFAYIFDRQTAHRFVGLIEEEAIRSYTDYLAEIDKGAIENVAAPAIARKYWNMKDDATLRDVVVAVRNDEAEHRDVNHRMATELAARKRDMKQARREKVKKALTHIPGYGLLKRNKG